MKVLNKTLLLNIKPRRAKLTFEKQQKNKNLKYVSPNKENIKSLSGSRKNCVFPFSPHLSTVLIQIPTLFLKEEAMKDGGGSQYTLMGKHAGEDLAFFLPVLLHTLSKFALQAQPLLTGS